MDIPKFHDSSLPTFTLWFIFIYMIGYSITFRNWDKKHRAEASSCLMSLAHGNLALILSILSLTFHQPILDVSAPNTPFHNSVLDHSIAYFTADLLHYILFIPSDFIFILHHLATLYVLLTCRYLFGHGALPVLGILALAEVTSTCQNTWTLARFRRGESEFLSPVFYGFYTVVRGVVGPLFVYKINGLYYFNLEMEMKMEMDDRNVIPRWGWISWMVVIVVGIGLSVVWVMHLWVDFYKHRVGKGVKKLS